MNLYLYNLQVEETMAWHHWQQSLSIGPSVRVRQRLSDELPRFRGVISGRWNSIRRSSARVTGFCASILNSVNAILDNATFNKLQNVGFLIYVVLHVMQFRLRFDCNIDHARVINFVSWNFSQNTLLVISSQWLKWMIYRHHFDVLRLRAVHIDTYSGVHRYWVSEFQVRN